MSKAKEMGTKAGLALGFAGIVALSGGTFAYSAVEYQLENNWAINSIDNTNLRKDITFNTPNASGDGVTVYVLDSGVDFTHDAFKNTKHKSMNFLSTQKAICPEHATAVAGIVAQVAPEATILSMRVNSCDKDRSEDYWSLVDSLEWIIDYVEAPSVVNLSATFNVVDERVDELIKKIIDKGIVFVGSAGNEKKDTCTYSPTHIEEAIIVGGYDANYLIHKDSAEGKCVDIFAPYADVLAADYKTKGWVSKNGTSLSAPFVTSAVALYFSVNTVATPKDASNWLSDNAISGSKGYWWETQFAGTTSNLLHIPNLIK